jgi:predicted RNase H-like nuclease (RuvC/YqgF family)
LPSQNITPQGSGNPYLDEIIMVYEKGLDSINMPGYDFFDFFTAIKAAGTQNEAIFKMAFQMGKTMDSSLTSQKLVTDADFYLSKLKDVHQKYADQGQQKLNGILSQSRAERESLSNSANSMEVEISRLRQQIADLEKKLADTRTTLSQVDNKYKPQQDVVEKKLEANDEALRISAQKLTAVRDAIQLYLK